MLLIGCFSVDPLNNSPTILTYCEFAAIPPSHPDGSQCSSDSVVRRGERIRLYMHVSDPDNNQDRSTYSWQAFACTADNGSVCIKPPYDTQQYDRDLPWTSEFEVSVSLPADVRSTSVDFEARDDRGGIASAFIVFHLTDAPARVHQRDRRSAEPSP